MIEYMPRRLERLKFKRNQDSVASVLGAWIACVLVAAAVLAVIS